MGQAIALSKRELTLDGLHCANCAMKIENGVGKIKGVSSCSVNFVNKTLTLEAEAAQAEQIASEALRTVNRIEPHIRVRIKPLPVAGASSKTSSNATGHTSSDQATTAQHPTSICISYSSI